MVADSTAHLKKLADDLSVASSAKTDLDQQVIRLTEELAGSTKEVVTLKEESRKAKILLKDVQTQLSFNPDGTVRNFTYDANVQREGLCRLIASNDLPLGFGESEGFVEYIKTCHNPNYKPVS